MGRPQLVSNEQIEEALRIHGGFVSYAADALGMATSSIMKRIDKSTHLQKIQSEIKRSRLDRAENALMKLMDEGNLGACCFYLKCQGKQEGWVEKNVTELEVKESDVLKEIQAKNKKAWGTNGKKDLTLVESKATQASK